MAMQFNYETNQYEEMDPAKMAEMFSGGTPRPFANTNNDPEGVDWGGVATPWERENFNQERGDMLDAGREGGLTDQDFIDSANPSGPGPRGNIGGPNGPKFSDVDANGNPVYSSNPNGVNFKSGEGAITGVDQGYGNGQQFDSGASPWQGGGTNQDFYSQQFKGLLDDSGEFQRQQEVARQLRSDAAENPQVSDWTWDDANGGQGLPEVVVGNGVDQSAPRTLNPEYEGLTNFEVYGKAAPYLSEGAQDWYPDYFEQGGTGGNSHWTETPYSEQITGLATGDYTPENQGYRREVMDVLFPQNVSKTPGGMNVSAGYASPINA
jgi:hypothetical protein